MINKIKICHVTSVHNSTDTRIFEKECVSLAKINEYDVYLVAAGESYQRKSVKVVGVGAKPVKRKERMFTFSKKVIEKALEIDAEIYHLHDPELLQYVDLLKKRNKIVIFDQHEDVADSILDKTYIPKIFRKAVALAYEHYSQIKLKKCDAIISVTPHIIEKLRAFHKHVYMVTNYPNISNDNNVCFNSRDLHKLIFAGGISEQWSHELIIEVLNTIKDVKYELYGSAEIKYLGKLQKLSGWEKVNYHGKVSFQEVQDALKKAGISVAVLQPSHNTANMLGTLGNTKLFESMAARLPVICTKFKLWSDIIDKYHCGICINSNSKEELKDAIEYLLKNPRKAADMGKNGLYAVNNEFNWGMQEKELYKVYNDLTY